MNTLKSIISEFEIRVFDESFERIKKCLNLLSEEDVWRKSNENITPIANQVLHIVGNAKQWVSASMGGVEDKRQRNLEFSALQGKSKDDLLKIIEESKNELKESLFQINEKKLDKMYAIQGFRVSGFSILIHVIEHASYHTGQITLLTKLYSNKNTDYYNEEELN